MERRLKLVGVGLLVSGLLAVVALLMKAPGQEAPDAKPNWNESAGTGEEQVGRVPNHNSQRATVKSPASPLQVTVQDPLGRPVAGATVSIEASGSSAVSDNEGEAILACPLNRFRLSARAPGRVGRERDLEGGHAERVIVVLPRAGCITGIVTASEATALQGLTVLAHPKNKPPLVDASILQGPQANWANPDSDGYFEICGLAGRDEWVLVAGGNGIASAPIVAPTEAEDLARISVEPFSFVAVECAEKNGRAPCIEPQLDRVLLGLVCSVAATENKWLHFQPLQALLAGVPVDWCVWTSNRRLLLAPTKMALQDPVGVRCKAVLPGYDLAHANFMWRPLQAGFQATALALEPATTEWGKLLVVLEGVEMPADAPPSVLPLAMLVLKPRGEGMSLRYDVASGRGSEGLLLGCIPPGEYEWWLESPVAKKIQLEGENGVRVVSIAANEVSKLHARIAGAAILEIALARGGNAYAGAALFRIWGPLDGAEFGVPVFIAFHEAPYSIPFLAEGQYRVTIDRPRCAGGVDAPPEAKSVALAKGARGTLSFDVQTPR